MVRGGTEGQRRGETGKSGEGQRGQRWDRGIGGETGGLEGGLRPWERSQGTPGSSSPLTLRFLRALASATFLMGRALISFQRCR